MTGSLLVQGAGDAENGASIVVMGGALGIFHASLASGAKIDLKNNSMVVDYSGQASPAATILSQLASGYAGGAWNGEGINTSVASSIATLGWKEDAANKKIVIDYTHPGDADLSGIVDTADFTAPTAGTFNSAGSIWVQGDFNYDGKVNALDFNATRQQGFGAPRCRPAHPLGCARTQPAERGLVAMGLFRRRRNALICFRPRE